MDSSEYLKFMTEKVVSYLDTPIEDAAKKPEKLTREPWLTRWFGVIPMGLMMWWGQKRNKKKETHGEVRSVNSSTYR
jgi:hypothetical protein